MRRAIENLTVESPETSSSVSRPSQWRMVRQRVNNRQCLLSIRRHAVDLSFPVMWTFGGSGSEQVHSGEWSSRGAYPPVLLTSTDQNCAWNGIAANGSCWLAKLAPSSSAFSSSRTKWINISDRVARHPFRNLYRADRTLCGSIFQADSGTNCVAVSVEHPDSLIQNTMTLYSEQGSNENVSSWQHAFSLQLPVCTPVLFFHYSPSFGLVEVLPRNSLQLLNLDQPERQRLINLPSTFQDSGNLMACASPRRYAAVGGNGSHTSFSPSSASLASYLLCLFSSGECRLLDHRQPNAPFATIPSTAGNRGPQGLRFIPHTQPIWLNEFLFCLTHTNGYARCVDIRKHGSCTTDRTTHSAMVWERSNGQEHRGKERKLETEVEVEVEREEPGRRETKRRERRRERGGRQHKQCHGHASSNGGVFINCVGWEHRSAALWVPQSVPPQSGTAPLAVEAMSLLNGRTLDQPVQLQWDHQTTSYPMDLLNVQAIDSSSSSSSTSPTTAPMLLLLSSHVQRSTHGSRDRRHYQVQTLQETLCV
jgi:hypothetical protein